MQRLLLPLSIIGTALIISMVGVASSYAALLKDIRIGEYEDHTRIVLELSESTPIERIIPRDPGQLSIVFTETQPQLTRKIPIENSRRVIGFKLSQRKKSLSLVLTFSFDHFRYELTNFKDPVRIALDVYALTSAPTGPSASPKPLMKDVVPGAFTASDKLKVLPDTATPVKPTLPAEKTSPATSEEVAPVAPREKDPVDESAQALVPDPVVPETKTSQSSSPPNRVETVESRESTPSGFSGLQFFLVVGLVIITIVILILLLLMLLSKQRWINEDNPLNANESLKRQDERIAALNAEVHEQLKRYDEA